MRVMGYHNPFQFSSNNSSRQRIQQSLLHGVTFLFLFFIFLNCLYQVSLTISPTKDSSIHHPSDTFPRDSHAPITRSSLFSSPNQIQTGKSYRPRAITHSKNNELLGKIFLSVKSTRRFHESRLDPILKTWFNLAKDQTWIFTDGDDPVLSKRTNGHVINTECPSTHYRQALCCKMGTELDIFLQSDKLWFCHFDDDNYVNVPGLLGLLSKYNPREYWYLGKPSLRSPIRIRHPNNQTEEVSFWFATGGAGFCLSRALTLRMSPLASGGKFPKVCDRIQLPDDVTVGYIAGHLLGQNLTVIPGFHSHFETMKFMDMRNPSSEITFSYVRYADYENVVDVLMDGVSGDEDPTRFLSLHCLLFPQTPYCPNNNGGKFE